MALFTGTRLAEQLAGVVGLSCYLPLADKLASEAAAANRATPIFMAHGTHDAVVDPRLGGAAHALLAGAGYNVEWHDYPMAHSVCVEELAAIAAFLHQVL